MHGVYYHGARRWEGRPEIRPAKSMRRVEHGPGLYLTSDVYAAGRYGKVMRFEIEDDLTLLDDVWIPLEEMTAFLDGLARLRHRADITNDMLRNVKVVDGVEVVWAPVLGNLMHYYGVTAGQNGVALVRFYVQHGVDASTVTGGGLKSGETWLVLYNLDRIVAYDWA